MHVVRITDLTDERLGDFARLTDVALRRRSEPAGGLYIAESPKVISRALAAGHRPRAVLVLERWLTDLDTLLEGFDIPVFVGESSLLEALTGFNMHRGALASVQRPALLPVSDLLRDARRVVILENIVDHTNVGAIFRSAAALGADAVLVTSGCADPLYRRSVRVSMGTVFQVPWTRLPDWTATAEQLLAADFHIVACALSDEAVSLDSFASSMPDRVAIVLGTEGDGLSRAAVESAQTVVTIPMRHGVDSLNVAAACAVALYTLRVR
ncbi:MAG: TrmH family RNA methyltransferase [Rhodoglobus sp.]